MENNDYEMLRKWAIEQYDDKALLVQTIRKLTHEISELKAHIEELKEEQ